MLCLVTMRCVVIRCFDACSCSLTFMGVIFCFALRHALYSIPFESVGNLFLFIVVIFDDPYSPCWWARSYTHALRRVDVHSLWRRYIHWRIIRLFVSCCCSFYYYVYRSIYEFGISVYSYSWYSSFAFSITIRVVPFDVDMNIDCRLPADIGAVHSWCLATVTIVLTGSGALN